jgi:hypothetical protein
MEQEAIVRQIPKKTLIYIGLLILAGILSMVIIKNGKAQKATKILYELGYTKVKNVSVFSKTEFINDNINTKGYQYALRFIDIKNNQECKGFVLKDFKGKLAKDLECK